MRKTLLSIVALFVVYSASAQVIINELQSSNDATIQDEAEEYDDWIELYNAGSSTVNVGGMILKDSGSSWVIPVGESVTELGAGEYLLIWADKDEEQGPLHANFKLSGSEGETLGLYENDGTTVVDEVTFPAVATDNSYARCDGDWEITTTPTPNGENTCTVFTSDIVLNDMMNVYPTITSGLVHIDTDAATSIRSVEVYSLMGQKLLEREVTNNVAQVDLSLYGNGMYVVVVNTEEQSFSTKIALVK